MSVSPSCSSATQARGEQEPQLPVDLSLSPPQILPSDGYVSTKPTSSLFSLLSVL